MSNVRIDQQPTIVIQGDGENIQIDQAPAIAVHGGGQKIQIDQMVAIAIQQQIANNVQIDQVVVIVVCSPPVSSFWPVILRMLNEQQRGI